MTRFFRFSRRLAWFAFVCGLLASALAAATPEPRRNVSIEFSCVAWDHQLEDVTFRQAGKDMPIVIPPFRRSTLYHYTGPAELVFTRTQTTSEGETRRVPVATVTVPEDAKRVLLLWASLPDGGARVVALPESPEAFPAGHARFYNETPYRVAVKTPGGVLELASGEFKQIAGDGRAINFTVQVAYELNGKWKRAGNNLFALTPEMRRTVFLTASGSDHFKLKSSDGAASAGAVHLFTITD